MSNQPPAPPAEPLIHTDAVDFFLGGAGDVFPGLSHLYARDLTTSHRQWCPQWWDHIEVMARVKALWLSWEAMHRDPVGLSIWMRDHLDPHMAMMLSTEGPMAGCRSPGTGRPNGQHQPAVEPLPHAAPAAAPLVLE